MRLLLTLATSLWLLSTPGLLAQNSPLIDATPVPNSSGVQDDTQSRSQADDAYMQDVLWIDDVNQPRSAFHDCMKADECFAIASAAAAYVGVPPQAMAAARVAAAVTARTQGEENSTFVSPPPGYHVCNVDIRAHSVAPASGRRASEMSIGASLGEIGIMTFTPSLGLGKGRSWWSGWFAITFVKEGQDRLGRCRISSERTILRCKGSGAHGGTCGIHRL